MNFLKKKLKPFASGFSSSNHQHQGHSNKDLEDDLYDEYVVEAPPHPSELIALGVDPAQIDANDPDKLRELYRKAKEQGKDKQVNSVLLAKQRQKEELEEKKRTKEEWKFFESLTTRVEQAVKDSQKTLEQLKESSAVDKLNEPEYELRQSEVVISKPPAIKKVEFDPKSFERAARDLNSGQKSQTADGRLVPKEELDEFGCPKGKSISTSINTTSGSGNKSIVQGARNFPAQGLLEELGIDSRISEEQRFVEEQRKKKQRQKEEEEERAKKELAFQQERTAARRKNIDYKAAARPRPRPGAAASQLGDLQPPGVDPFDTSFLADDISKIITEQEAANLTTGTSAQTPATPTVIERISPEAPKEKFVDPFDTSYVGF